MSYDPENIEIPPTVEWVIYKDDYHHISEFARLPLSQRPQDCLCPVCGEPVILKLGDVRQHHYAHHDGVECASTRKETAEHYNTKITLYQSLRKALSLEIISPCSGCVRFQAVEWIDVWDEIRVEYTIGGFRPDIAILDNGRVIAAIEIYVSNLVSEEKKAFYDEQGIKWIELQGSEAVYRRGWSENVQLEYTAGSTGTAWTCDSCKELKSQGLKTSKEIAAEKQKISETKARIIQERKKRRKNYKKNNGIFIRAVTPFDIYRLERFRLLAIVYIKRTYGATVKTWITVINRYSGQEQRIYSYDGFVKDIDDLRTELIHYLSQHYGLYDAPLGWLIFPDEPEKIKENFIDLLERLLPHYEMQDDEWVKKSDHSWGDVIDRYKSSH